MIVVILPQTSLSQIIKKCAPSNTQAKMAMGFASLPSTTSPDDLRMHLVRCISTFSTEMHNVYSVFAPPALSLAPFQAADQLVQGHGPVRFAIPGPNDAYFCLERTGGEIALQVELRCKLQNAKNSVRQRKRPREPDA